MIVCVEKTAVCKFCGKEYPSEGLNRGRQVRIPTVPCILKPYGTTGKVCQCCGREQVFVMEIFVDEDAVRGFCDFWW